MGARGPAPTPTATKKARGTYRPDRAPQREAEPELVSTVPPPPKWLTLKTERDEWNRTAAVLVNAGLLSLADFDTLALYCRTKINYLKASRRARRHPVTIAQSGYEAVGPWVTITKQHLAELIKLGASLGMNPASRTRIEANPKQPGKRDGLIQ